MATSCLKEMGKFCWEGREKGLPCWLSQFSKTKVEMFRFYLQWSNGAKLFNMLPIKMRKVEDPSAFKTMTKKWIWENIPSY